MGRELYMSRQVVIVILYILCMWPGLISPHTYLPSFLSLSLSLSSLLPHGQRKVVQFEEFKNFECDSQTSNTLDLAINNI